MTTSTQATFDLTNTYIHLTDGPEAVPVEVRPDFWEKIESRADLQEGRLVTVFHHDSDWNHAEMHPAGEEVVYVLSGGFDLILEQAEGEQVIAMQSGLAFIIPRGVWHRAIVHQPGEALFITRGAGTQTRPV